MKRNPKLGEIGVNADVWGHGMLTCGVVGFSLEQLSETKRVEVHRNPMKCETINMM